MIPQGHLTSILLNNNKSIDNSYILSTLFCQYIKIFARTIIAALFATYPFLVGAGCSITNININHDAPTGYSNEFEQVIAAPACPSDSQSNCSSNQQLQSQSVVSIGLGFSTQNILIYDADTASIIAQASQAYAQNFSVMLILQGLVFQCPDERR